MHHRVSLVAACALLIAPSLASALAVTSFVPGANATNVARGSAVTIEFDAPLATGSVTAGALRGGLSGKQVSHKLVIPGSSSSRNGRMVRAVSTESAEGMRQAYW